MTRFAHTILGSLLPVLAISALWLVAAVAGEDWSAVLDLEREPGEFVEWEDTKAVGADPPEWSYVPPSPRLIDGSEHSEHSEPVLLGSSDAKPQGWVPRRYESPGSFMLPVAALDEQPPRDPGDVTTLDGMLAEPLPASSETRLHSTIDLSPLPPVEEPALLPVPTLLQLPAPSPLPDEAAPTLARLPAPPSLMTDLPTATAPLPFVDSVIAVSTPLEPPDVAGPEPTESTVEPSDRDVAALVPVSPTTEESVAVVGANQKRPPLPPEPASTKPTLPEPRPAEPPLLPTVDPLVLDVGSDCPLCQPGQAMPILEQILADGTEYVEAEYEASCWIDECSPWRKLFGWDVCRTSGQPGIGRERLDWAGFDIDYAIPSNYVALRYESADNLFGPDRSAYFWSPPPSGPSRPETGVDYQNLWVHFETGNDSFSMLTELPIRFVTPDVNENTSGLGDLRLATKTVLVDGRDWKLTNVFRTYLSTGSSSRGLGTGHVSLEPGLLVRYQFSERMTWNGELKLWIPLGAEKQYSSTVIEYGFGANYLLCDTDSFAIIPTLEFTGLAYNGGAFTRSDGLVVSGSTNTFVVSPGARFVLGPAGDFGLFEVGVNGGLAIGSSAQFESVFRVEFRWNF